MISEKYILVSQILASTLMGLDYFLTEEQRRIVNEFLKKHLHALQQSEQNFLLATYLKAKKNWLIILGEFLIFSISLTMFLYIIPFTSTWLNTWISLSLILVSMLALFSSANKLFAGAYHDGLPFAFSLLKLSLTRFLIRCPKGTGFGIGFLFLTASFIFRGINIDW